MRGGRDENGQDAENRAARGALGGRCLGPEHGDVGERKWGRQRKPLRNRQWSQQWDRRAQGSGSATTGAGAFDPAAQAAARLFGTYRAPGSPPLDPTGTYRVPGPDTSGSSATSASTTTSTTTGGTTNTVDHLRRERRPRAPVTALAV